jgi:hypothetical protein
MVSVAPQRQIASTVERIGASKKNIDIKKPIGQKTINRIMSQKSPSCRLVGLPPRMRSANPFLSDFCSIALLLFLQKYYFSLERTRKQSFLTAQLKIIMPYFTFWADDTLPSGG